MRALLVFAVVMLSACQGTAERHVASSNPDYDVERLFTVDGCTVYRFSDGGASFAPHYFTNCGSTTATEGGQWQSRGKGQTTWVPEVIYNLDSLPEFGGGVTRGHWTVSERGCWESLPGGDDDPYTMR